MLNLAKLICLLLGHRRRETGRDKRTDVDLVELTCSRCGDQTTVME